MKTYGIMMMAMLLASPLALAHGHTSFKIGEETYEFTVGSLNEPIYVDDKSGVDLRVAKVIEHDDEEAEHDESAEEESADHPHEEAKTEPVLGLESTLKVEISAGDQKKVFDLRPAYGAPGAYTAPFYPTVATTYTYRVFGTINDIPFDYTFACNPAGHVAEEGEQNVELTDQVTLISKEGSFGCPQSRENLYFPEKAESLATLSKEVAQASSASAAVSSQTSSALAAAKHTNMLSIAALLVGIIALGLGVMAWRKK